MALSWTDNPATNNTHVRAVHINELRRTINRNRRAASLALFVWSDGPFVSGAVRIRAVHFNEIRAAIPPSVPLGSWSVGSAPSPSRQVSARDINDLRRWVDQFSASVGLSAGPDPVPQGVTSFTVDENSAPPNYVMVDSNWIQDILNLGPNAQGGGPLRLRSEVRATLSTGVVPTGAFVTAFQRYASAGIAPCALLSRAFDFPGSPVNPYDQNQGLTGLTNPYIDHFATTAENFANQVKLAGGLDAMSYFIWNEPNNQGQPPQLDALHFGALLYQCYNRIKALGIGGSVNMGGLLWPYAPAQGVSASAATQLLVGYLTDTYNRLLEHNVGSAFGNSVPWDAITVHVHHCGWSSADMGYLRSQVDGVFDPTVNTHPNVSLSDKRPVYVGEWGITHDDFNGTPGCLSSNFSVLEANFDAMWYFSHPVHTLGVFPGSCTDHGESYGLVSWDESNVFRKTGTCNEWASLQALYQVQNP